MSRSVGKATTMSHPIDRSRVVGATSAAGLQRVVRRRVPGDVPRGGKPRVEQLQRPRQ